MTCNFRIMTEACMWDLGDIQEIYSGVSVSVQIPDCGLFGNNRWLHKALCTEDRLQGMAEGWQVRQ